MKEAETRAIKEGILNNGVDDGEVVIRVVLGQRHKQVWWERGGPLMCLLRKKSKITFGSGPGGADDL